MILKEIKVGGRYAYGTRARDHGIPEQVEIIDLDHEFDTYVYGRMNGQKHKGILARIVSGPREGEDVEIRTNRNIWRTWAEQEVIDADMADVAAAKEKVLADRATKQQAEIDHMLALLPRKAWEGLIFKPGQTPHLTVHSLTRLLKAARTQALIESGDE
jgi:hypothetical protein